MSVPAKLIVLILVGAVLAALTRRSLSSLRSHGPYRLCAWMSVCALVLLNIESWFEQPFALRQLLSWMFLLLSAAAVVYAALSLRRGGTDPGRAAPNLIGIEKTALLVTTGAYRYVRHPMYTSILLGAIGVFLKHITVPGAILLVITGLLTFVTAKVEERENVLYFGDSYRRYMTQRRMFFPFLL